MCGIAGVAGGNPGREAGRELVRRMIGTIPHRGPDGVAFAAAPGCALGFCRLAIVDPRRPARVLANEDGTVRAVVNGEIYDADETRRGLLARGHRLEGRLDTGVVPHLWEEHGPDLPRYLDGMFALAVHDARRRVLLLARDRAGEKPLFFALLGRRLLFASELRALLAVPGLDRSLDPVGLRRFLLHGFFPAPYTPVAAIRKLPPGHRLLWDGRRLRIEPWWDLAAFLDGRRLPDRPRDLGEAARRVDAALGEAVRRRKRSDVPVGVFLSGGIDSGAVLAHLAEQEGAGVPAFTLGHEDRDFDESSLAARTARHFGADLHVLRLGREGLAEGLRLVLDGFDEPLADASIVPTRMLAGFARQRVKVVLSGEGSDELFGGYPTYPGHLLARRFLALPPAVRRGILGALRRVTPVTMGNVGADYLLERFTEGLVADPLERHHRWFGVLPPGRIDRLLAPRLREALAGDDPFASARALERGREFPDLLARLLYQDVRLYLGEGLLTKVDRATMMASLEARAPFLDHRLAELAAGLPSHWKVRFPATKVVLRRALAGRLPAEVLRRRKRGFNIPFSRWLLEGLGGRFRERFARERVLARGLLEPGAVIALLEEHLARRADHRRPLFALLVLDAWCDRVYGEAAPVPLADVPGNPPGEAILPGCRGGGTAREEAG